MKTIKAMKLPVLLLAALLPVACQQEDTAGSTEQEGLVPLQLTSGISSSVTRAFNSSWQAGDVIGVFTTAMGDNTKAVTHSGTYDDANIPYKTEATAETASGTAPNYTYTAVSFTAKDDDGKKMIYLPADGSAVDVYAYSPYATGYTAANGVPVSIPTEQTGVNQKTADLMMASYKSGDGTNSLIYRDNPSVSLQFTHCLSKVLVRVVVGTGYNDSALDGISVKITRQPTAAKFDPLQKTATPLTIDTPVDFKAISPLDLTGDETAANHDNDFGADYKQFKTIGGTTALKVYRFLLLPNITDNPATNPATCNDNEKRQIIFTVGSVTYTHNISETFEAGQQTVYTLTLAATEVTLTAAITPWATGGTPENTSDPLFPQAIE